MVSTRKFRTYLNFRMLLVLLVYLLTLRQYLSCNCCAKHAFPQILAALPLNHRLLVCRSEWYPFSGRRATLAQ